MIIKKTDFKIKKVAEETRQVMQHKAKLPVEFFYETRSLLYDEFAFLTGKKESFTSTQV